MIFLNFNKGFEASKSISLYKKHITTDYSHTDEIRDTIINVANEIKSYISDGENPVQAYKKFYTLISLFRNGKTCDLQNFWMGEWNTTMSDKEKILEIYRDIFKYTGFFTKDDIAYEYNNEILWKIQREFDFARNEDFADHRLDYFIYKENKLNILSYKPVCVFYYQCTKSYDKKESSFNISHSFNQDKNDGKLYCDSKITFYSPNNSGITEQFTVFCKYSCNLNNRLNYTEKENIELDKWVLRKVSFLQFLESTNCYKQERAIHLDDYVDAYWFDIYTDNYRNKIKLG